MNGPRSELAVEVQGELDRAQADEVQAAYTALFGEVPAEADAAAAQSMELERLKTAEANKPIDFMIRKCARCGCDHVVKFFKLYRPHGRWTHWGICPITDEPVLQMTFESNEHFEASEMIDAFEAAFCRMIPVNLPDVFGREKVPPLTFKELQAEWIKIINCEVDPPR